MVVAQHLDAARIGVEVLQRGGNAVDAAVAAYPFREPEFRWIADQVLGGMPDTACGCANFYRR